MARERASVQVRPTIRLPSRRALSAPHKPLVQRHQNDAPFEEQVCEGELRFGLPEHVAEAGAVGDLAELVQHRRDLRAPLRVPHFLKVIPEWL